MEQKKLQAAIEAILFAMGGSVELKKLAQAIGHDEETTKKIIRQMMDRYEKEDRGIRIIELEASFQNRFLRMYFWKRFRSSPTSSRLQNWKSKKSVASNRIMQSASW